MRLNLLFWVLPWLCAAQEPSSATTSAPSAPASQFVPAFICGNARVEVSEVCDDGNTIAGDGCFSDCSRREICGDGFIDAGESCDDANPNNDDECQNSCELPARFLLSSRGPGQGIRGIGAGFGLVSEVPTLLLTASYAGGAEKKAQIWVWAQTNVFLGRGFSGFGLTGGLEGSVLRRDLLSVSLRGGFTGAFGSIGVLGGGYGAAKMSLGNHIGQVSVELGGVIADERLVLSSLNIDLRPSSAGAGLFVRAVALIRVARQEALPIFIVGVSW